MCPGPAPPAWGHTCPGAPHPGTGCGHPALASPETGGQPSTRPPWPELRASFLPPRKAQEEGLSQGRTEGGAEAAGKVPRGGGRLTTEREPTATGWSRACHSPPHLAVADAEDGALDEAALLLGPGEAVRIPGARIRGDAHVRTGGGLLPAVPKVQLAVHHHVVPRGEVIAGAVVEVPTQPAHRALRRQRAGGSVRGLRQHREGQAGEGRHAPCRTGPT